MRIGFRKPLLHGDTVHVGIDSQGLFPQRISLWGYRNDKDYFAHFVLGICLRVPDLSVNVADFHNIIVNKGHMSYV